MPYSHPQPINRETALRQIAHLAPGACAFALLAGFINSVVLGFFSTPVSHMSGAVSHLGLDLAKGRLSDAWSSLAIVVGFLLGAILAGVVVGGRNLLPGRRYGTALAGESLLLIAAVFLLNRGQHVGLPLASMACGLQNAVTSSYCGLMIRSTHVTGTVTDIGVMIGHWIRHRQIERWKLMFLIATILAFTAGGWIGAVLNLSYGVKSLLVPAAGVAIAAAIVWRYSGRGWLKIEPRGAAANPRTASFPGM